MTLWSDERVWAALHAWRWEPPGSTRVTLPECELVITPGSSSLNFVYGFSAEGGARAEAVLEELRHRVEALGGTGLRIQVTPMSRPVDLVGRLEALGYAPRDQAEVLVCELRDDMGHPRFPEFRELGGVVVREAFTDPEYDTWQRLMSTIFGEPEPSEETRRAFHETFLRRIRETGHSDRYIAWAGEVPVGVAGMELAGPVARFFATGVLPAHRRRGVYGLLVRARCEDAVRRGAEVALTTARVGSSGPILKHHGFRPVGPFRVYELAW